MAQILGIVQVVKDVEQKTDTFSKRDLIVKTVEEFENTFCFEFHNDKTKLLNETKVGDLIAVDFNLQGRASEYEGKTTYFTTLKGWRITKKA